MTGNKNLLVSGLILAFALATQGGCAGTSKVTEPAALSAPSQSGTSQPVLSGKVVETMNAGGYTYICLEKDGKTVWVAAPPMEVKVGDEISLLPGAEMGPFVSKTLNRTFDKIIFSGGPVAKPATQQSTLPSGHPALPGAPAQADSAKQPINIPAPEKMLYAGKVVETMNSGGYTYICLEKDGKRSWAAVPPTEVKVGDEIVVQPGIEMGTFTSKTLNRTFGNIIFSPGVEPKK